MSYEQSNLTADQKQELSKIVQNQTMSNQGNYRSNVGYPIGNGNSWASAYSNRNANFNSQFTMSGLTLLEALNGGNTNILIKMLTTAFPSIIEQFSNRPPDIILTDGTTVKGKSNFNLMDIVGANWGNFLSILVHHYQNKSDKKSDNNKNPGVREAQVEGNEDDEDDGFFGLTSVPGFELDKGFQTRVIVGSAVSAISIFKIFNAEFSFNSVSISLGIGLGAFYGIYGLQKLKTNLRLRKKLKKKESKTKEVKTDDVDTYINDIRSPDVINNQEKSEYVKDTPENGDPNIVTNPDGTNVELENV